MGLRATKELDEFKFLKEHFSLCNNVKEEDTSGCDT